MKAFPLLPNSKIPATKNGFKDAVPFDDGVVSGWLEQGYNIGLVTGVTSGIVVVDVDAKNGGYKSLAQLEQDVGVLDTYTVDTPGGGKHFYFQHPGQPISNKAGLMPGIDIRGDGGYVVAPPSSINGKEYKISNNIKYSELPPELLNMLSPPPKASSLPLVAPPEGARGVLSRATLTFIAEGAPPGQWHHQFVKAAMDLKEQGYTEDEAHQRLMKVTGELDATDVAQLADVYSKRGGALSFRAPSSPYGQINEGSALSRASSLVVRAQDLTGAMSVYLADKDKVKGEPTGIVQLDELLGGGKRLGEITAWHAEAKAGKNTIWHKLMHTWLKKGISIGYASRELTPETEVLPNLLSLETQSNAWLAEVDETRYNALIAPWPLYFAEGYGYLSPQAIERFITELQDNYGVQYFWFDHLHYMLEDPEDHKAASKLVKELKSLAKRRNVHIDLIIQPNKLAEGQKLSLNSIKGGSAMGQAIDNLVIIERVKQPGAKNVSKITLDVARSKLARLGSFYLEYNPDTTDFQEVDLVAVDTAPQSPPTSARPGYDFPRAH